MKFIYPGWQNIITLFEFYSNKLERCYGYSCSTHASLYDPRFSTALWHSKINNSERLIHGIYKNPPTIYYVPLVVLGPANKETSRNILETVEKHTWHQKHPENHLNGFYHKKSSLGCWLHIESHHFSWLLTWLFTHADERVPCSDNAWEQILLLNRKVSGY